MSRNCTAIKSWLRSDYSWSTWWCSSRLTIAMAESWKTWCHEQSAPASIDASIPFLFPILIGIYPGLTFSQCLLFPFSNNNVLLGNLGQPASPDRTSISTTKHRFIAIGSAFPCERILDSLPVSPSGADYKTDMMTFLNVDIESSWAMKCTRCTDYVLHPVGYISILLLLQLVWYSFP